MTDTVVSDALPGIQDEGLPNIADDAEDWGSAGLRMLLAQAAQSGSYVRSDSELDFTNHDGTNNEVDVTAGVAYLDLTGETITVQSGLGGSSPPSYDTTLPVEPAIPVILPSTTSNVPVQDATLSAVWVAYATDSSVSGVSPGDIYLRSDDTGSVTAPPHPSVKLGETNPDSPGSDTLTNRYATQTFETVLADSVGTANNPITAVTQEKSQNASYHVFTDGSEIWGISQENDFGPDMDLVTGTDIGTVLDEIRLNQLPPQGSEDEAVGVIELKRGEYPGTLGEFQCSAQMTVRGEVSSHYVSGTAPGRPQAEAPVVINGEAGVPTLIPPDTTDQTTFTTFENIEFIGPGPSDGSAYLYDDNYNSRPTDWLKFERVVAQDYQNTFRVTDIDNQFILVDSHILDYGDDSGNGIGLETSGNGYVQLRGTAFYTTYAASNSWYGINGQQQSAIQCKFSHAGASSIGDAAVRLTSGGFVGGNTQIKGDTNDNGVGVKLTGDSRAANVIADSLTTGILIGGSDPANTVIQCALQNCDTGVRVNASSAEHTVGVNRYSNCTTDIEVDGSFSTADTQLFPTTTQDVSLTNSPVRPRWFGVIGGGPLGGVDLGSVSGQYDGDEAMADGTTGTAYLHARWDATNTQWVQSDGTAV